MRRHLRIVPTVAAVVLALGFLGAAATGSIRVAPLPPAATVDERAGACYSFYPDPVSGQGRPFMPLAHAAGSRWDRFDFVWPRLQRSDGTWSSDAIEDYDSLVDDLVAADFNIIGILLWTPDWAATDAAAKAGVLQRGRPSGWYAPVEGGDGPAAGLLVGSSASSPPGGLYQSWDDWTLDDGDPINSWGRFVHQIVSEYADRVKHWEMWNEPEWDYFWTGSVDDYAQLLKVGYQATKAACPDCQVLFGGLHYWADPDYYEAVLDVLNDDPEAAENDYYFDVMSVHLYSRSSNTYNVVNEIEDGMTSLASAHPIWITETGVPVWGDAYGWVPGIPKWDWRATSDQAAAYTLQSYANALAAEVERYLFFRVNDDWCDKNRDGDCDDEEVDFGMNEPFGLVRDDHTLRPAYNAYQVATRYLISPTMVTNWTYGNGARRVTLWGTPHGKVSVVWNTTPHRLGFDYEAALPTATAVDQRGGTWTLHAVAGRYEIALVGATANLVTNPDDYFIGGEPLLIVEEDTVPPGQATIGDMPSTTYSRTIPVSWAAGDDQSGIWGFDVQVRIDGGEAWSDWLGLAETEGLWSASYGAVEHDRRYCFRARAWDRAGNVGDWSEPPVCTRIDVVRELRVSVGAVFGDEDSDGVWDIADGESALTRLSFRLVDGSGADVVTPTRGATWQVTATLPAGVYALRVAPEAWPAPPPGWLPLRARFDLPAGAGAWELDLPWMGLVPHRASCYAALVSRGD